MSQSFPVSYKSENNSVMKKYYQLENAPSTIKLETDICLKNLVRQISDISISSLDSDLYNEASNVVIETANYNQNLSIEDPNCSIVNPTTFCISSNYEELPVSTNPVDEQSYVVNVGSNNFASTSNTITSTIELASDNSPIFDTDLMITLNNNDQTQFLSTDNEKYAAVFDNTNANFFLHKMMNSNYTYLDNTSLLTIAEDTDFNTNYALGNALNTYYVKNAATKQLEPVDIDAAFTTVSNTINIVTDVTKMNNSSPGSYKINISEAFVGIDYQGSSNVPGYLFIGNDVDNTNNVGVSSMSNVAYYQQLMSDMSSGNNLVVTLSNEENLNNGLNFADGFDESFFTFDNSTMIGNINFMQNIIYQQTPFSLRLTQLPMSITHDMNAHTDAFSANNNLLSLTSNGELLVQTDYNTDGEIVLQIAPKTERTTVSEQSANIFLNTTVDYDTISEELKNNRDVSYEIVNKLMHTADGRYAPISESSGAAVFATANSQIVLDEYNIPNTDNEFVLIQINPSNELTSFESDGLQNYLYVMDNDDAIPDVQVDAKVYIKISGDLRPFYNKYDLRFKCRPKTITELGLNYAGDANGKNSLAINESALPVTNNSDQWILSYAPNTANYVTSSYVEYSPVNIFPTEISCKDIIKNDTDLNMSMTYVSGMDGTINATTFDKVLININGATVEVTQNDINDKINFNNNSTTYQYLGTQTFASNKMYHVIKQTIVDTYNVSFPFQLAGTSNLIIMSPQIRATTVKHIFFDASITVITFTVDSFITEAQIPKDIPIILTNRILFQELEITPYLPTKMIRLLSDDITLPVLSLTLNKQSVTYINGVIQYRNKNLDGSFTAWSDIDIALNNLDPYLNTFTTITSTTDDNNPETNDTTIISLQINKNESGGSSLLILDQVGYTTPLRLKTDNLQNIITLYKYNVNDVDVDFPSSLNPYNYLGAELPQGVAPYSNLVAKIEYVGNDPNQGNATYTSVLSVLQNLFPEKLVHEPSDFVLLAKLTVQQPTINIPIVVAKINKDVFSVKQIINGAETNQFVAGTTTSIPNFLDLSNGVSVTYQNMERLAYINFSLNSDKIGVQNVKTAPTTTPLSIQALAFLREGCETVNVPFYRGYFTDDQTIQQTYTYTINRSNLVSCSINAGIYEYSLANGIYTNRQNTIVFDNGIGSIGSTVTSLFSRLSAEFLTNNERIMNMAVSSDYVTISRRTTTGTSETNYYLQDFKLYSFNFDQVLKSSSLRVLQTTVSETYSITYDKSFAIVYYSSKYVGNPNNFASGDWNQITNVPYVQAQYGFTVNSTTRTDTDDGTNNGSGHITITLNDFTNDDSTTYFVIAAPQLKATQIGIDGIKTVYPQKTNASVFDSSKILTNYAPVVPDVNDTNLVVIDSGVFIDYFPFLNTPNVNNVKFRTSFKREISEYALNAIPNVSTFDITGTNVTIQELKAVSNAPSQNGPNNDGIIFNGLINELLNLTQNSIYYDYIKLDEFDILAGALKLSYIQEKRDYFDTVFSDTIVKPVNNIKFIIGNCFIPVGQYKLVSSVTKGVKINIYDMVKRENDIVLLKYEQISIDFTNLPVNTTINQLYFTPTKVYESIVSVPADQFGSKYLDKYNNIAAANMNIDASGNIIWNEIQSTTLLENFSLQIKAINTTGLNNLVELLYSTKAVPINFTVFKQSNIIEMLTADGTPKFIITPFGQIQTPSVNTRDLALFDLSINSNVEILKGTVTLLNQII